MALLINLRHLEKDAVRLPSMAWDVPLATLPMTVDIEPPDVFESWLMQRLGERT